MKKLTPKNKNIHVVKPTYTLKRHEVNKQVYECTRAELPFKEES